MPFRRLIAIAILGVSGTSLLLAQDRAPAAGGLVQVAQKDKTSKAEASRTEPRRTTNRLPNYYGKVGLTADQRERIYAVQRKYNEEIDALEAKIAELKEKRDAEIYAVLTKEQKDKLESLQGAAKKRRSVQSAAPDEEETEPAAGKKVTAKDQ